MTALVRVSLATALVASLASFAVPSLALADPPAVSSGECLYLVGAPPGAPAAAVEERVEGSRVVPECTVVHGMDLNRDGDNMIQGWTEGRPDTSEAQCLLSGWVGHEFTAESAGTPSVQATVTVEGAYDGEIENRFIDLGLGSSARIVLRVVEDPRTRRVIVAERIVADFHNVMNPPLQPAEPFAAALTTRLRASRPHAAELVLELHGVSQITSLDFGAPASGRFARYDAIEVCVAAPPGAGGTTMADLERDLHERRCMPSVWLPEAHGGQLESAQELVATRLAQVVASGARGVNESVASRRLAEADAHAADGDYQAACRSLSLGLRALTTP